MPFPNEHVPSVSPDTNLFVFKDTTNNSLYLCIGSTALGSSRTITSRSGLPLNTKCAALTDDASTGINSSCPSPGNIYPEKSYVTYDTTSKTLTIREATVTNNINCSYTTAVKTVKIPTTVKDLFNYGTFAMNFFYTGCPSSAIQKYAIVRKNTSNVVSVRGITASNLCVTYSNRLVYNEPDNGGWFSDQNVSIPSVGVYQGSYNITYNYGLLMVSWYNYPSPDASSKPLAVNFSFSCGTPERRIGFIGDYHQMSNLEYADGAFSSDFDVVDNNNYSTKFLSTPVSSSKLFPIAAYPGSQGRSLKSWCTITATINRVRFPNVFILDQDPSAVFTIPVFAEWY